MTLYVQQELRERIENSTQVASPSAAIELVVLSVCRLCVFLPHCCR